jgi:hypothetical protein
LSQAKIDLIYTNNPIILINEGNVDQLADKEVRVYNTDTRNRSKKNKKQLRIDRISQFTEEINLRIPQKIESHQKTNSIEFLSQFR